MPPYNNMNPASDFYQRNAQMYQPPYQQFNFPQRQVPQPPAIHAAWVTGIEEARAARSDDFLAVNLFLDTSTGRIYMKRIGNDGMPQFISYAVEENPQAADPLSEINSRLSKIEKFLGGQRNESVPGNEGFQQPATVHQPTASEQNGPNGAAEPAGFPKNAGNDKWQKRR